VTHPYRLNEQDARLAQAAADVARDVLAPNAADVDHNARFPEESLQALRHQGLLGLCVQTALGGEGAGMRAFAAVAAPQLASVCPVVGAEEDAAVDVHETFGGRAHSARVDVLDHRRAGFTAVALPQLLPVASIVGGEVQRSPDVRELRGVGVV